MKKTSDEEKENGGMGEKEEEISEKEGAENENEEGEEGKIKEKKKKEIEAVVNIYTSFNNTLVHVTDMSGKTIAKVTGGMVTKHGRLKANPTIAMFIAKRISEIIKDMGIKNLYVRIRAKTRNPAPGPGANPIIKSLSREGYKILDILDTTRLPRGGPKKKGGRRGRRP
jgi:small subunit ribosomal protein S11